MFGYTFSNLDNEVQFLRRSMSWVNDQDFLVLDLPAAATDSSDPSEIVRRDRTLARKRAGVLACAATPLFAAGVAGTDGVAGSGATSVAGQALLVLSGAASACGGAASATTCMSTGSVASGGAPSPACGAVGAGTGRLSSCGGNA